VPALSVDALAPISGLLVGILGILAGYRKANQDHTSGMTGTVFNIYKEITDQLRLEISSLQTQMGILTVENQRLRDRIVILEYELKLRDEGRN
jgi:regulator of replication initiation timing